MPCKELRQDLESMKKADLLDAVQKLYNNRAPINSKTNKSTLCRLIRERSTVPKKRPNPLPHKPNRTEPKFTQKNWIRHIRHANCYAYALGDARKHKEKSTPGTYAGIHSPVSMGNCKELSRRVLADNPKKVVQLKSPYQPCPKQSYKIIMVTTGDKEPNQGDFHFYRHHPTGVWSHKRGWSTPPLLRDSRGKIVWDPIRANRSYEGLNYKKYCSSFCVRKGGKTK